MARAQHPSSPTSKTPSTSTTTNAARPRHASHLYQRTAGRIGSLTRPIRQAAISDGTERITKTTLEAIRLDHLAETHHRPRTRTR